MVRGKKTSLFEVNDIYNKGQYFYFENVISNTPSF